MTVSNLPNDASIERGSPLGPLAWLGLGGPAEILARPRTPEELAGLVKRAHEENMPFRVLGAGSNVLIADEGVKGMVAVLSAPPFKTLARTGEITVQAGAGTGLARLLCAALDWGLSGLEGLAGIPGTVGGALKGNSGTPWGEIGPLVKRVWALEPDGHTTILLSSDYAFGYRASALGNRIILGAELKLAKDDPASIRYRMNELLEHRARTQPGASSRHTGCVFKNPPGMSAGKILDELGLKGRSIGGARVSETHANFIEVREDATAADVKALIDEMRRRVREGRGIELEPQIELWGLEGHA